MLGQRDFHPVPDSGAQQLDGLGPARTTAAGLLGSGEPDQTEFIEPAPQLGDALTGLMPLAVRGEDRRHHLDQFRIDGTHLCHLFFAQALISAISSSRKRSSSATPVPAQ